MSRPIPRKTSNPLAESTGGTVVSKLSELADERLSPADRVTQRTVGDRE